MSINFLLPEIKQLDATVIKDSPKRVSPTLYLYHGKALCWLCIREDDATAWRDEDICEAELNSFGVDMLGCNADHVPTLECLSVLQKTEYFRGTYCPQYHGPGECDYTADGCMSQEQENES